MGLMPTAHSFTVVEDMQIVGECPGEKSKRPSEEVEDEVAKATRPPPPTTSAINDKLMEDSSPTPTASASVDVQAEASPQFASHDGLRKHLIAQSHRQAQMRKARALQLPWASPYSESWSTNCRLPKTAHTIQTREGVYFIVELDVITCWHAVACRTCD